MTQRSGSRSRGWSVRTVLVAAAALAFLLAGSAPAWAHASLIGTDPVDGALLPSAPTTITLTFNEPVSVDEGGVRLLDASGAELPSSTRAVDNTVVTTPGELGTGTVIVSWRVISADSHPITGGFTFAVGERSSTAVAVPTTSTDPVVGVAIAVVQALTYLGVLAAAGLIAFDVLVLRGGGDTALRRAIRRLSAWCAGAGMLAGLGLLPLTHLRQQYESIAGLADLATWTAQLGRDAGLALVIAGAGLLLAWEAAWAVNDRTAASAGAALAGCGLAVGSFALVGHTRGYGPVLLVLTADLLHLTVAAFWLGGLVGLGLVVRSAGRAGHGRPAPSGGRGVRPASATRTLPRSRVEVAAVALSRFSTLAAALVAVLGVAGVLLAWRILGSWSALVDTGYGQALLVKLGLVVAALAVAGYNRFVVLPAIDTAPTAEAGWVRLRRSVSVEAGLLVAVLAVTGWLVNASPTLPATGDNGGAAAAPVAAPQEQTVPLGAGTVSARLTPATAGINSLEFSVVDANGQPVQPVSDPEVSVTMPAAGVGPLTRPVSVTGQGAFQAVLDLPLSGQWVVTISVRTSEFEQPSARIEVDIP
ncbi:copper resistance CopC/CopD family protein [Nakamurella sp.]|uniref:copper resistance CopC/CopD family protein n=1 Tax=Nakamurella sp. TaxID=1869182 RepID=UPI003785177D